MQRIIEKILNVAQRRLLWLLLGAYALAALAPGPGGRVRDLSVGEIPWLHGAGIPLSAPLVMLSFLLFNAGFGANLRELGRVKRLWLIGVGLAATTLLPILFALGVSFSQAFWHSNEASQTILVGLALIGSMPVAGSSTAWSQNSGGNVALSLGLILASTLSSPLLAPLCLNLVGYMAQGDYAEDLHDLAFRGSSGFLIVAVVVPSAVGALSRVVLGPKMRAAISPALQLLNLADLLALNYANASSALPQVFHHPEWGSLLITILITTSLCVLGFGSGRLIAHCARADAADRLAMMFGMGMSNNGTGLVLASTALPDHPQVMLPLIIYNLAQQIVAGIVDARSRRLPVSDEAE